jgi:hypothetical protein
MRADRLERKIRISEFEKKLLIPFPPISVTITGFLLTLLRKMNRIGLFWISCFCV